MHCTHRMRQAPERQDTSSSIKRARLERSKSVSRIHDNLANQPKTARNPYSHNSAKNTPSKRPVTTEEATVDRVVESSSIVVELYGFVPFAARECKTVSECGIALRKDSVVGIVRQLIGNIAARRTINWTRPRFCLLGFTRQLFPGCGDPPRVMCRLAVGYLRNCWCGKRPLADVAHSQFTQDHQAAECRRRALSPLRDLQPSRSRLMPIQIWNLA